MRKSGDGLTLLVQHCKQAAIDAALTGDRASCTIGR